MPFTVTMPKLSPTMEEGTIAKWHLKEGERIAAGGVIIEVSTDKATVEHSAIDEGYLRKIIVNEGETARVNQPIAIFTETADESIEGYKPEGEVPPPAEKPTELPAEQGEAPKEATVPQSQRSTGGLQEPSFVPMPPLEKSALKGPTKSFQGKILASPLAKKIAQEKGIDLASVRGSGPNGRIESRDLETAAPAGIVSFAAKAAPKLPPGSYREEPLTQMRKVVGKRLQESKTFVPHFYVTQEMDAEPMVNLREQLKAGGLKVTFNDFIVRSCALALKEHPQVNSGFNTVSQSIIHFETIDISIAVSLPEGLITPIIRHADYKNLGLISSEVKALAKRARNGKLQPEEFQGGSFSISNLGMFGVRDFIAVINPPQAAILAIGGIQEKPVVRDGELRAGKTISMTLSADHRVMDGADSARFMGTLKTMIENPSLLLV